MVLTAPAEELRPVVQHQAPARRPLIRCSVSTVLFSGSDFSFIFTEFVPYLNVKPSILKPDYVLEVANGKKVETDRIIRGCKLELGDSLFTIDLIPFGHGSFDVIVVMDWLSRHKAEIVFMRRFPVVFPEELSGFPPQRQVGFCIDLVSGATSVVKISVSTSTIKNARVIKTALRVARQEIYSAKSFSVGRTCVVCEEEGRFILYVHRLPRVEEASRQESLSTPQDQRLFRSIARIWVRTYAKRLAYASRQLRIHDKNYTTQDLELGAMIFALKRKENLVVDALSRKERVKPRRVRTISKTIQSSVKDKILAAQGDASKVKNAPVEVLRDLDQQMEKRADGGFYARRLQDEKLARIYIDEIVARHGVLVSIISDCNGRFTSLFWQTLQKALGIRLDMSTAYHPQTDGQIERTIQMLEDMLRAYHSSIQCAPFKALYGKKCRSPILWAEVKENQLIRPEMVQETTDRVVLINERLKAARDRQKSYADNRRKPLEFEVGDQVLLKVSPWKGLVRFRKKHKLLPRYVGPFEVLERIGLCLVGANLHVPLEEINVDKTLRFVEEHVEIMDHEVKKLKRSRIPIVKVRWNSRHGPEFPWEREDFMKAKYPNLFVDRVDESTS
ncbi:putative reverse transcriptase domain-containing protein [Tanacetum coccineum]